MRYFLFVAYFSLIFNIQAQNWNQFPQQDFIAPFAGKIEIIGTFCELRPNHFHGGLDIRTDAKIGRHVLAIADGYISRINISTTGYGKALYITHKNGYTSVYAHLHDFPPSIKWYITKNHYLLKRFEMELYPEPDLLQVKQGEMIAYSGNTGGSQGPHLHFEIRETKTEQPVNPLLCGIKMKDVLAPTISNVYLYRKDSTEKLYNGHYPSITLNAKTTTFNVKPGTYSFGANIRDMALSAGDNNGVNYIEVYKNNELFYKCEIEKFDFAKNRMFNHYIDYRRYKQGGVKMHKLFIDENNTFGFWNASPHDGWFTIHDTTTTHFKIVAKDVYGNKREKNIHIIGNAAKGTFISNYIGYNRQMKLCLAHEENRIQISNECEVFFPKNSFYSDYKLPFNKISSNSFQIGNDQVPVDKKFDISILLNPEQQKLGHKYTICYSNGKSFGGEFRNNRLTAKVKELGTYYMALDTIKPSIQKVAWNKNGYFSFIIRDNLSGIKNHDFYIDDEWVLLEYEYKNNLIFGKVPNKIPSGKHIVKLIVRDNRDNEKILIQNLQIP